MANHAFDIPEDELRFLYVQEKKSMSQIGKIFGCDGVTVKNRMRTFGIQPRTVSQSLKGRVISWAKKIGDSNKGRILSQEHRDKVSATRIKIGYPSWNKGLRKFTNPEKIRYGKIGSDHWNWKGGISPENARIRQSSEYKAWRSAVFQRDKWTCVICGEKPRYVQADHIKPFSTHPELRFDIENGRTLCVPCHKSETKRVIHGN